MSWTLSFGGDIREVTEQFEAEQGRAKTNRMPALEQTEIGDALNFVRHVMLHNEGSRVTGTASGHWNLKYKEGGVLDEASSSFGRISVAIDAKGVTL